MCLLRLVNLLKLQIFFIKPYTKKVDCAPMDKSKTWGLI